MLRHSGLLLPKWADVLNSKSNHFLLISNHFTRKEIESSFMGLETRKNAFLMGAIVDKVKDGKGWELSSFKPEQSELFFAQAGRERRQKAVGRWHSRPQTVKVKEEESIFDSVSLPSTLSQSLIQSHLSSLLPSSSFLDEKNEAPKAIISISDSEPLDFHDWLSARFESVPKISCIAASTPFTTGLHQTLFVNNVLYSEGTVGIALHTDDILTLKMDSTVLYSITPTPLEVTKSQGNIILELDSNRASNLLVKLVSMDELKNPSDNHALFARITKDGKSAVVGVVGGDVSKGTLALDTSMNISTGSRVEFLRSKPDYHLKSSNTFFSFSVLSPAEIISIDETGCNASSENGIVVAHESVLGKYQVCKIPQVEVSISISN
jgi:hypothetical protein